MQVDNARVRKIILASSSPRRREILARTGLKFLIDPAGIEEDMKQKITPQKLVVNLAREKAQAVAIRHPNAVVLAADTVAASGGKAWSKPENIKEARMMLTYLSGKTHDVWTGFVIIDTKTGRRVERAVRARHTLRKLTSRDIETYLARKESLGGAGAYSMQETGTDLSERIVGDYNTIVGFPLAEVLKELKKFGVSA